MTRSTDISITADQQAILATIAVDQLDYMSIERIKRHVQAYLETAPKLPIILDLTNVGVVSSLIMGALVDMLKRFQERGHRFLLVGLSKSNRSSFSVTRIDQLFEIFDTVEQALSQSAQDAATWR